MISYDHCVKIYYKDVDQMGVVYYSRYFEYFEESRTELLASIGLGVTDVEENGIIVFVGNKDEALGNYNKANLVDLQGKTMLPAFLDGHGHFYNVGFTAMCANILPPPDGPGVDFNSVVETLNKYKETEKGKYVLEKLTLEKG